MEAMADSLRGKLLVASPALIDPNFARTVVLITEHTDDGAMGVVLNRPSETEVDEVAPGARPRSTRRADLRRRPGAAGGARRPRRVLRPGGGRLDRRRRRRLRRRRDRRRARSSSPCAAAASTPGTRAGGRASSRRSSRSDAWIVEPPLPAELFPDDPEALWHDVLERKGGQFALIARMPDDPSLN